MDQSTAVLMSIKWWNKFERPLRAYCPNIYCDLRSHAGGLTSLAISKSGRLIFAGYDNITLAYIWDTIKGKSNYRLM